MRNSVKKMNLNHPAPQPHQSRARKTQLTFGDFVAGGYSAWGKRKAEGLIRLAAKTQMIVFRGQQPIVVS